MTDEQKNKKDEQEAQVPPVPAPSTAEMEQTHADELAALQQAQADELGSLQQVNEQRYKDVGDIVAEAEAKLGTMKVDDETAQKRSEAFRYIAGLGDTLSGLANVVGTSFGAQNQQQTYNGGYVAEKAEQARKERKLEMDKISSRLDEMRAREKDLKASGSLAEAELKAKQARETVQLQREQKALEREEAYKNRQLDINQTNADANYQRALNQANKPTKPEKPDKGHEFDLVGGERIEIPSYNWNDTALSAVYNVIPDELKTRRARRERNVAGVYEDVKDATGNIIYHTPTKQEMLNDIIAAAKVDEGVANALRAYIPGRGANDPEFDDEE